MLNRKIIYIICMVLIMGISVNAYDQKEDIGKIFEMDAYISWSRMKSVDAFMYIDSNYSEVAYYYSIRRIMDILGAEIVWGWDHGDIKIIHEGKEYYIELQEILREPARGRLTVWMFNENGEAEYIVLNEMDNEHYMNYVMYNNRVFISMCPDLVELLAKLEYSVEINNEYNEEYKNLGEYIERIGSPSIKIYKNPIDEEVSFYLKEDKFKLTKMPIFYKNYYYYVPMEEILELAGVQMEWFKLPWEYDVDRGYYVFRGNRDIPPIACFWSKSDKSFVLVLYEKEDHEHLNYRDYIYDDETYERLKSKTLLRNQMYLYNNAIYIEVEDLDFILDYFGNYKIYADEENKTVHMERKGLKTP